MINMSEATTKQEKDEKPKIKYIGGLAYVEPDEETGVTKEHLEKRDMDFTVIFDKTKPPKKPEDEE